MHQEWLCASPASPSLSLHFVLVVHVFMMKRYFIHAPRNLDLQTSTKTPQNERTSVAGVDSSFAGVVSCVPSIWRPSPQPTHHSESHVQITSAWPWRALHLSPESFLPLKRHFDPTCFFPFYCRLGAMTTAAKATYQGALGEPGQHGYWSTGGETHVK